MKYDEIKMSHVRSFLAWQKTLKDCPFTKKGLWEIQKECWISDLELYWGNEGLSDKNIEEILENGLEGMNTVFSELWDWNYDYIKDIKSQFIEDISITIDMVSDEMLEYLRTEPSMDKEEIFEENNEDFREWIRKNFEEELSVDLCLDEAIKNTYGKVWVDSDDIYGYELESMESISENFEKLLFFSIDKLQDKQSNIVSEAFAINDHTYLDSPEEISVCIADSLEEYIDMLVNWENAKYEQLENKNQKIPDMEYGVAIMVSGEVKQFTINGTPYFNSEGYYSKADHIDSIEYIPYEQTAPESAISFEEFLGEIQDMVKEKSREYVGKHLHNPKRLDEYGRTLMHYALVLEDDSLFDEVVEGLKEHCKENLYKACDEGISPLVLLEKDEPFSQYVYNTIYLPLIEDLPKRNTTSTMWETEVTLEAVWSGVELYVLESYCLNESYAQDEEVLVLTKELDHSFHTVPIKDLEVLLPCSPKTVYLDGTVAA